MERFLKYFEDKMFVHWVLNPTPELEDHWQKRMQEAPDERDELEYARFLLGQVKIRKDSIDTFEVTRLYAQIIHKIEAENKKKATRRIVISVMRYAAVALLFLTLGVLIMDRIEKNQTFANFKVDNLAPDGSEASLILADGSRIALTEKESVIEHDISGNVIINRDTVTNQEAARPHAMNQLIMPYGKNSSVRLPDGTVAYLNAGSRLVYPSQFRGKTREVLLMGEGYFKVEHDPAQPFVVRTNELSIVALGTSFNVSAYPTDKFIETVLVKGSVAVRENTASLFKKEVVLQPGQLASFNRETFETTARQVEVADYTAWHEGYLNFQATDLNRIAVKLERYYNIRIYINTPMLGVRRISGKLFLSDDKDKVLESLASTSQAELVKINEVAYGLK